MATGPVSNPLPAASDENPTTVNTATEENSTSISETTPVNPKPRPDEGDPPEPATGSRSTYVIPPPSQK